MKRRTFLIALAAGVVAACSWWFASYFRNFFVDPIARPELLLKIMSRDDIRAVGRQYRKQFPLENDKEILKEKLQEEMGSSPVSIPDYEAHIKEDFNAGNIVIIEGWILSVTGARQCALFSIIE